MRTPAGIQPFYTMKIFYLFFLLPVISQAQLQLAGIFSDNMLLQRDHPVHIWGKAIPGKTVEVYFADEIKLTSVKADSTWSIHLRPQKADSDPKRLTVNSGQEQVVLQNIIIGDIWVCIGQSNMEWPMIKEMHFQEASGDYRQPALRFYNPSYPGKNIYNTVFNDSLAQLLNIEKFYSGHWEMCDSSSVKSMSAVAFYFGKSVLDNAEVPVGLINLAIGGAPLESFIGKNTLLKNKKFSSKIQNDWLENDALPAWIRERGKQNIGNVPFIPGDENGKNHAYKPGFAYAAGIAPLFELPVKGVICYQGESNAQEIERVNEYAALSKLMMDDYRKNWKQSRLPFYFVQLSSIDTAKYKGQLWPEFRNEQRKMLQLIPHSGMAVCSDIGARNDVHPTNKKAVGERLARWALNKTYQLNIMPSGPLPVSASYSKEKVVVSFEFVAKALKTSDGGLLKGFSLDGRNEVEALFDQNHIIIHTSQKPDFVYYGWKSYSEGNLVNSEGLPASTFKIKVRK